MNARLLAQQAQLFVILAFAGIGMAAFGLSLSIPDAGSALAVVGEA